MLTLALLVGLSVAPLTPPAPTRYLTDEAGLLSRQTRETLDGRLETAARNSGQQFVVWIGKTTGGEPIELFAERAFKAWKVGRAGLDDGVVLFVFAEDRSLRLEVGYGLESVLPDATCARLINERIRPKLASGDADGALTAGIDAVLQTIGGGAPTAGTDVPPLTVAQKAMLIAAGVAFLLLLIFKPRLAFRLLGAMWFFSGGRRRHGGGGFTGGGGRSGGGGASGRW